MKLRLTILVLTLMLSCFVAAEPTDVYLIFYATAKGATGHVGLAVDNYQIVYHEIKQADKIIEVADTLATGELTYYDLWPDDDYFNVNRTGKDIPAVYYKLPVSTTDEITVNSLYDNGIPHKEKRASDGLLKIKTSWHQDQEVVQFLDSIISSNIPFNARKFNCSDFVRLPLEKLLGYHLDCKEFVLTGWSSTPNKLYRKLRKIESVEVLKNADDKTTGSFLGQRVLYKILHRKKQY